MKSNRVKIVLHEIKVNVWSRRHFSHLCGWARDCEPKMTSLKVANSFHATFQNAAALERPWTQKYNRKGLGLVRFKTSSAPANNARGAGLGGIVFLANSRTKREHFRLYSNIPIHSIGVASLSSTGYSVADIVQDCILLMWQLFLNPVKLMWKIITSYKVRQTNVNNNYIMHCE